MPDSPLFEFDPSPDAMINPTIHLPPLGFPSCAVVCWFGNVVAARTAGLAPAYHVPFEHGDHPICIIEHRGRDIALVSPGVGAPAADQMLTFSAIGHVVQEKKLLGCLFGSSNPHREVPRLLSLWRRGALDLESMISYRRPLAEINDGFDDMRAGRGIRTVLTL